MPHKYPLQIARLLFTLWLLPAIAHAEEIALQLPSGLKALANYRAGARDRPAVLVLHGFLQTHHFSTVRLIASEVSDAGYAVLSPTLTLNIDQRQTSLSCDAIQSHTVEQANSEIGAWVDWLKKKGYAHIILIGHSTGSNHLLHYLHSSQESAVRALIATGVGPLVSWKHPEENNLQRAEAEAAVAEGDNRLKHYTLGFCHNNYASPASSFLSYMQWDKARILRDLKTSPVPTTVVLGRVDNWLPPDWPDNIEREAIPLVLIDEANHYFSGVAEFDFQSAISSLVANIIQDNEQP